MSKLATLFKKPKRALTKGFYFHLLRGISFIFTPLDIFLAHFTYQKRGNKSITPFVIISWHRSGSTYLCDLLDSHTKITCHFELFKEKLAENPLSQIILKLLPRYSIEKTITTSISTSNTIGFKIFPDQWRQAYNYVRLHPTFKKIVLERENFLKRFVSKELMRRTGVSHSTDGLYRKKKITIDIEKLRTFYKNERRVFSKLKEEMDSTNQPWILLTYEELTQKTPKKSVSRILHFLGVKDGIVLTSQLEKLNKKPAQDYIINKDEVKEYLRKVGQEHLLFSS